MSNCLKVELRLTVALHLGEKPWPAAPINHQTSRNAGNSSRISSRRDQDTVIDSGCTTAQLGLGIPGRARSRHASPFHTILHGAMRSWLPTCQCLVRTRNPRNKLAVVSRTHRHRYKRRGAWDHRWHETHNHTLFSAWVRLPQPRPPNTQAHRWGKRHYQRGVGPTNGRMPNGDQAEHGGFDTQQGRPYQRRLSKGRTLARNRTLRVSRR